MANTPNKVVVIGLDCCMPHLVEKHISEGYLPTFKRLIERGVLADNCHAPFPTVTPPNWAAIASGAWGGTHGITDFHNHEPGEPLDNDANLQNWDRRRVQAEYIWEALDKAGKKCVVLNYPSSWPSDLKNSVVVGGVGMTIGEDRIDQAHLAKVLDVCADFIITTDYLPQSSRGEFAEASGWENLPEGAEEPLEMKVEVPFPMARMRPAPTTWWVLVEQNADGEYVKASLCPSKDYAQAFCTLEVGQWSERIDTTLEMSDGTSRQVFFKCKLLQLDGEAEEFRFLVGAMIDPTTGCHPVEVAKDLAQCRGSFHFSGGMVMAMLKTIDLDTYVEMNQNLSAWLSDAAAILLETQQPELLYLHSHPIDWMYHLLVSDLENPDPAISEKAWEVHRRIYECEDALIARILESCDRNTLVVLVSDHGATADGPVFDPYQALVPAGLAVLAEEQKPQEEGLNLAQKILSLSSARLDFSQTKAVANREIYIYVNLKGRDPEGIVEPADYETVQQQIIDALLTYVDPGTGKRPVALALSRRDARILGLHGDRVGDVVYAVYPWFGAQHGQILPTAEHGVGKLKSLLVMQGPGLKKNYRLQRTCWLPDLVPTLCYLMDWPLPETAEGAVIYQALKDPDLKAKEIVKLKESLARMEEAVNRESRQPWDHHDCA